MTARPNFCRRIRVIALAAMACTLPVAVAAQNTGMQELLNRVERLQREISTLQQQVYKGGPPPARTSQAGPAQPGAAQRVLPGLPALDPRSAGRNSIRTTQLENELRRLTGRMEEVDFRIQKIQSRLEKLVSDMDQRLTALEGGLAAATKNPPSSVGLALTPPPGTLLPPGAQGNAASIGRPASIPPPPAAKVSRAAGVLGTIPENLAVSSPRGPAVVPAAPPSSAKASAVPPVSPPAAQQAALPPGTPQSQYEYALSLMLKQQDFAKAESALSAFIDRYPKNKLTGNAHYWLGETYFVRKRYQDAVFAFAEGFQKFPKSNKAPDNLLKLGMSLDRMQKRKEACTAYSRLLGIFPKAGARMKARVQREQRRAKCR